MKSVFTHITCRSLVLLFAMQTLNLSINSFEFYTISRQTTVYADGLDYIDSMVEFLMKNVMSFSKHTFDNRAYNNDIAKLQQNNVHWDLKWVRYSITISGLKETQQTNTMIIPINEKALTLYYQEVRPKPPQLLYV